MTVETKPQVIVRPRRDSDIPALADILRAQQPTTEYPVVWSRPMEEFLERDTLHAWVAEVDGDVLGHIALTVAGDGDETDDGTMARMWADAHGVTVGELRAVSLFFADVSRSGSGIGHALHDKAVEVAKQEGYPVLDVVSNHSAPVNFYLKRGWGIIGEMIAPWARALLPDSFENVKVYLMTLPKEA